ncbi:MAG: hypothetical protein QXL57_08495 [Candidatus Bathyarchaeia archaeon]
MSICHVLEPMIYGWLQGKVYLSNTIKPIRIENITVERAVKRVRRYAVEDEGGGCGVCGAPAEFEVSYVLKPPGWGFGTVTVDILKGKFCRVHYEKLCRDNLSVVLSCKPLSGNGFTNG